MKFEIFRENVYSAEKNRKKGPFGLHYTYTFEA